MGSSVSLQRTSPVRGLGIHHVPVFRGVLQATRPWGVALANVAGAFQRCSAHSRRSRCCISRTTLVE